MKNTNLFKEHGINYQILLVEDDEDDFYIFNLVFSSINSSINLLRTANGIQLLSLIQSSLKFDAIFLDINMPYKCGLKCLKEMRSMEELNSTRIVMYTTSNSMNDIEACYELGANFYLVKPCSYASGINQLKSLFSNPYFMNNRKPPRSLFVGNETNDAGLSIMGKTSGQNKNLS